MSLKAKIEELRSRGWVISHATLQFYNGGRTLKIEGNGRNVRNALVDALTVASKADVLAAEQREAALTKELSAMKTYNAEMKAKLDAANVCAEPYGDGGSVCIKRGGHLDNHIDTLMRKWPNRGPQVCGKFSPAGNVPCTNPPGHPAGGCSWNRLYPDEVEGA